MYLEWRQGIETAMKRWGKWIPSKRFSVKYPSNDNDEQDIQIDQSLTTRKQPIGFVRLNNPLPCKLGTRLLIEISTTQLYKKLGTQSPILWTYLNGAWVKLVYYLIGGWKCYEGSVYRYVAKVWESPTHSAITHGIMQTWRKPSRRPNDATPSNSTDIPM